MDAAPLLDATPEDAPADPALPPLPPELRRVDLRAPSPSEALLGLGGLLALGATFAFAAPRPAFQLGGFVVSLLGAFVFTGPTLIVLHPAWGHTAPTDALLRTLSWSLVRTGRLALALSPLALLFVAAGSRFWPNFPGSVAPAFSAAPSAFGSSRIPLACSGS